MMNKIDN